MADAIILRSGGAAALDDITANASDILAPKVGLNKDGDPITGTIQSMAGQTVTPSNKSQTVSTSGKYMTGNVTVNAVSNLTAANIKQGATVGGIAGTFTSDANATSGQILAGRTAYVKGQKITGTIVSKGAQTVTPTKSTQRVSVNGNYMTGDITVNSIPSNYITTTDANAVESDIRRGRTAYVNGFKITGNVEDYDGAFTSPSSSNVEWVDNSLRVKVFDGIYRNNTKTVISQSILVSKIGLTASKILAKQTVAGITGTATSDANATASWILSGKTAYVNGAKVSGTMKDNQLSTTSAGTVSKYTHNIFSSSNSYIRSQGSKDGKYYAAFGIPSGYYDGNVGLIFPQDEYKYITPSRIVQASSTDKTSLYGPVTVYRIPETYTAKKQIANYFLANGNRDILAPNVTNKGIHLNLRDTVNTDNTSAIVKFGGKFDSFLNTTGNRALIIRMYTNINDQYFNRNDIYLRSGWGITGSNTVLNRVLIAGTNSAGTVYNRMEYGLWNMGFGFDKDGHFCVEIYCLFRASSTPLDASIEPVIMAYYQEVYDAANFY